MIGHLVTLSETNTRGYVGVCECGWYGIVHNLPGFDPTAPSKTKHRREAARDNAEAEHARHCEDVRADIARRTDEALKVHAEYLERVVKPLRHVGRFGNG